MNTSTLRPSYRIGPMPTIPTVSSKPPSGVAIGLGIVAIGLLIGLVVVVKQGVERGERIRAAMAEPSSGLSRNRLDGRPAPHAGTRPLATASR